MNRRTSSIHKINSQVTKRNPKVPTLETLWLLSKKLVCCALPWRRQLGASRKVYPLTNTSFSTAAQGTEEKDLNEMQFWPTGSWIGRLCAAAILHYPMAAYGKEEKILTSAISKSAWRQSVSVSKHCIIRLSFFNFKLYLENDLIGSQL